MPPKKKSSTAKGKAGAKKPKASSKPAAKTTKAPRAAPAAAKKTKTPKTPKASASAAGRARAAAGTGRTETYLEYMVTPPAQGVPTPARRSAMLSDGQQAETRRRRESQADAFAETEARLSAVPVLDVQTELSRSLSRQRAQESAEGRRARVLAGRAP